MYNFGSSKIFYIAPQTRPRLQGGHGGPRRVSNGLGYLPRGWRRRWSPCAKDFSVVWRITWLNFSKLLKSGIIWSESKFFQVCIFFSSPFYLAWAYSWISFLLRSPWLTRKENWLSTLDFHSMTVLFFVLIFKWKRGRFIYILDSSNSSSFTFWSSQFRSSSRNKQASSSTGNSNGSWSKTFI